MALPYDIISANFHSRMTYFPSCQSARLFQIVCRCLSFQDPQGPSLSYGHMCHQVVTVSRKVEKSVGVSDCFILFSHHLLENVGAGVAFLFGFVRLCF